MYRSAEIRAGEDEALLDECEHDREFMSEARELFTPVRGEYEVNTRVLHAVQAEDMSGEGSSEHR